MCANKAFSHVYNGCPSEIKLHEYVCDINEVGDRQKREK